MICVAAWNIYHKRIDFLINEVAGTEDPRMHLLLCGHPEPDSAKLKELARRRLGNRAHWYTLPERDVPRALLAADAFVLPSVTEHFGSAALEALYPRTASGGSSERTRLLSDTTLQTTDLNAPGSIQQRLIELKANPPRIEELNRLAQIVQERFSEKAMANTL